MATEETNIVQRIRLKAGKIGLILWRNNIGAFQDKNDRWVKFGVGGDGGSDLIGGTPIKITKEHIGKTLLVLTVIEVKTPEGMKPSGKKAKEHFDEQIRFINLVVNAGGIGKIICSEEDL